jgi:hypothetical protein
MRSAASGPLASALAPADQQRLAKLMAGPSLTEHASKHIPIDLVRVKDVRVFMATPGASDPDLPGLKGMGIGLKGTLLLDNKLAGKTDSYLTDIDGMKLAGSIADFSIPGFLSLKDASLDVKVPMPLQGLPYFKMKGQSNVLLHKGLLDIELSLAKIKFISQSDWGAFGYANIHAESYGPSLLKPTDFLLEMEGGADVKNGIRKQLIPAMLNLVQSAEAGERQALAKAETDIKPLKANLATVRTQAGKNKKSAESGITAAQKDVDRWDNKLDDIDDDIDDLEDKIDDNKDDPTKWDKVADWGIQVTALRAKRAGVKAAYVSAKAVLKAAKSATQVVPIDAYPEVIEAQAPVTALQAEIDTLKATLAANAAVHQIADALNKAAKQIPLSIEEMSFKDGSMAKALKGTPQTFRLKLLVALPGKKPLHLDTSLKVNLLNPAATDFKALARVAVDAVRDIDRLLKAQEGDDDDGRKRKSKRAKPRPPMFMFMPKGAK